MKLANATATCATVATQLESDLRAAEKIADKADPFMGWVLEELRVEAFRLKNRLANLAEAAKRSGR